MINQASTALTPARADAYRLLRDDLMLHLYGAEYHATKAETWTPDDEAIARELIPDLVNVLNGALLAHEGNCHGRCRFCRETWPCATIESLHRAVKDPKRQFITLVETVRA
ncbi:hypothetical protein EV191_101466 [Tamaricihabitans halophyticus]|uniref:Uncharacterized protein n=1 Tax=Tamaricihabitans halophyticus TaxID=1262583 RepID=A0A4R2R1Y4_9PSEU|nr:hypothetical protein [Tamaricihabitans halophyticus]TCP56523.1 hypothetical protein EV191_101466 [Tamaricihabitans halophyticus]